MNEPDDIDFKNGEEDAQPPFKIGKSTIDLIIEKYLSRKLCEEIDYLKSRGGIKWLEMSLKTSILEGLPDSDTEKIDRINAFDSNEPPLEEPISKYFDNFLIIIN